MAFFFLVVHWRRARSALEGNFWEEGRKEEKHDRIIRIERKKEGRGDSRRRRGKI